MGNKIAAYTLAAIAGGFLFFAAPQAFAQDCGSVPTEAFPTTGSGMAGVWTGTWTVQAGVRARDKHSVTYCTQLHISITDAQTASVMFCSAAQAEVNIPKFCIKPAAKLTGNSLTFTTRSNYTYTFTLTDPSTLHGQFVSVFNASEQRTVETDFHK